jgi:hypothetical protein
MLISVSENVVTKTNPGGPMKFSYRTVSLTFLLVVFAFTQSVFAQVSIGGTPYSFENSAKSSIAKVTMPGVNVNALMAEDKLEEGKDIPYRFGHPFDVNYNLKNSGTWETLENGDRLWRLHIKSGNAYSINLIYSDFYLPTGARLYVYSADKAMVLGGFTHLNNKEHSQFATAPVKGSESIVEYYEPKHAFGQGRIQISRIVHGYRDVFYKVEKGFGDSGPCNINVNCEDGDDWQDEKRAVAMILTGGGNYLCSGAMVNNVEQDLTPYFLTAYHCLGDEETWIVMFNYESAGCENVDGPTSQTVQGTTLLASNSDSDFALLLLSETPPAEYNIHYAGWSALDVADATSVGIHHPSGDIKKISFDYDPYVSSDYTPSPYLADSHWEVTDWDDGTTEGGSSGSPLFDSNQRIVGQLHGGWAACGNDLQDYYGKFSMSWDRGPSASSRLRDWLDPNNTGTLILNGRDMSSVTIVHTPLMETEDTVGPYTVTAEIFSTDPPLEAQNLWLKYGYTGSITDSVLLQPTGGPDEFSADIPGGFSDVTIVYYLSATDASLEVVTHPAEAPANLHAFYVGADVEAPVVTHSPLTDIPLIVWPASVRAEVTDNLGVSSVEVSYLIDGGNAGTFALTQTTENWYEGEFDFDASAIDIGSVIEYKITATDAAIVPNTTSEPESGYHSFEIIDTKGEVLVVDDDPETKFVSDEKGSYVREFPNGKDAASSMADILTEKGYVVEVVDMATAVGTDFSAYTLVIHSSGGNETTITNDTYRQKLIDYVTASIDNKLIVEGGEVGFDWDTEDAAFAASVLHANDWNSDNAGTLNVVASQAGHPLLNSPNVLSSTLEIAYDGYGDEDAIVPTEDAFVVFDPANNPGEAGINVFDPTPNPASGQIVYMAFNAAAADADKFAMLLENAADYLHAQEAPPTGGIEITVDLTDTEDDSGASVNITGPLTAVELTTDASGMVSLSELYDGIYFVAVSKAGYNPLVINDTLVIVDGSTATGSYSLDANSADTKIMGTVTLSDAAAAEGATVTIVGQVLSATTDAAGAYMITSITAGDIVVSYAFPGYSTKFENVTIANGEELTVDVELDPGYFNDFEVLPSGVALTGGFEEGAPSSGPGAAYDGSNLAGTNLAGDYANNAEDKLTLPAFDITGMADATFKFMAWYDIETSWDGFNIKVSTDGGSTFTVAEPIGGYNDDEIAGLGEPGFTGHSGGWVEIATSLAGYGDGEVLIQIHFGSDGFVQNPGVYVDDLQIVDEIYLAPPSSFVANWAPSLKRVDLSWSVLAKMSNDKIVKTTDKPLILSDTDYMQSLPKTLEGYNLHRSINGADYMQMNDGILLVSQHSDGTIELDTDYYYFVEVVYESGSAYSDTLIVNIPSDFLEDFERIENGSLPLEWWTMDMDQGPGSPDFELGNTWLVTDYIVGQFGPIQVPGHSGDKWVGAGYNSDASPNNDYLIFPAITVGPSGGSVSFWAQSISADWPESFEILMSSAEYPDEDDFDTQMLDVTNVPDTWTEYVMDLGSYVGETMKIAIRYNSTDKFVLMVDDISIDGDLTYVSVDEFETGLPTAYALKQNYPNPFNPTTTIAYDLPRNSDVTFNIYSVTGQLVRTLNQGSVTAGRHSVVWDGKDFNGNQLASGIYFYQIKAGSFNKTMKMMLVK